ncbi:hypothetical protein ACNOYE_31005 [Nannocystaceae bacterium ST9]
MSEPSDPPVSDPATRDPEPIGRDRVAYDRALVALDEAMLVANTDPEQGILLLNRALAALHQFAPLLALDQPARQRRSLAHLALARAKLARGDEQGAAESMDATLRELGELELPIEQLGPTLGRLVEERRAALVGQGTAHLRVICASACELWIDEHPAQSALDEDGVALPLGSHRVWIEDPSGQHAPLRTSVELVDSRPFDLQYPPPSAPPPELAIESSDPIADRSEHTGVARLAPRWAELLTTSLGVGTLAAGASLWAIDSTCPGGVDPSDVQACPQLYDTRTAGITTVALGSAMVVVGAVLLTIDEGRARRRGHEVTYHAPLGLRF